MSRFSIDWSELSLQVMVTFGHFLWQACVIGFVLSIAQHLGDSLRDSRFLLRLRPRTSRIGEADFRRANMRYVTACLAFFSLPICVMTTFAMVHQSHGPIMLVASDPVDLPSTSMVTAKEAIPTEASAEASLVRPPIPMNAKVSVSESIETSTLAVEPVTSPVERIQAFSPYLLLAYVVGVGLMLARFCMSIIGSSRLRRTIQPITDAKLLRTIAEQCARVGLKRLPIIALCHRVSVPVVVGIVKPMILLPPTLLCGLDPDQVSAILSHELAHIRRYDLIVNLLQRIVEALLFFHPVTWWISRRVSVERENCCDDVAASCMGRLPYAKALLQMAELCIVNDRRRSAVLATMSADGGNATDFGYRVRRLIGTEETTRVGMTRRSFAVGLAVISLLAVSLVAWGQSQASKDEERPNSEAMTDIFTPEPLWQTKLAVNEVAPETLRISPIVVATDRVLSIAKDFELRAGKEVESTFVRLPRTNELGMTLEPVFRRLSSDRQFVVEVSVRGMGAGMPDGSISSCGIRVLRATDGGQIGTTIHQDPFFDGNTCDVDVENGGDFLVLGMGNHVHVYRTETGAIESTMPVKTRRVDAVAISPDREWLVVSDQNDLHFWRWREQAPVKTIHAGRKIDSLVFTPDGQFLAEGPDTREDIQLRDMRTLEVIVSLKDEVGSPLMVSSMDITPDGRFLVAHNEVSVDQTKLAIPHRIHVWDLKERGKPVFQIATGEWVRKVAFSDDGRMIVGEFRGAAHGAILAAWQLPNEIVQRPIDSPIDAKDRLGDGIQWSRFGDENGLLSGARLILPQSGLKPGQPLVVEYRLANVSKETKTLSCYLNKGMQFTSLSHGNRIGGFGLDCEREPVTLTIEPGDVFIDTEHLVSIDTTGLEPGKYQAALGSAFFYPDSVEPNMTHELPHRGSIPFTIVGESTSKMNELPKSDIHWGAPIAGLQVGARFLGDPKAIAIGESVEADLFVANVTDQPIECSVVLPHPGDGWLFNVEGSNGHTIMLQRPLRFSSPFPQEYVQLKLAPGEVVVLTKDQEKKDGTSSRPRPKFEIADTETEEQGWSDYTIKGRLVTQGGKYSAIFDVVIVRPEIPALRLELDSGNVPFAVLKPTERPWVSEVLDEVSDQSILWGESVGGMRLGIRQSEFSRRRSPLRHGEHIDYEVWIKNETDKVVQIARDPRDVYCPKLMDDRSINIIGGGSWMSFSLPQSELAKAELILLPGQAAHRFPLSNHSAPIRPPGSPRGRFGSDPLLLEPGKYSVYAELGELKSGVEEVEVIPAAWLQIRKASRVTEKKREYAADDPSEAILAWQTGDGEKNESMVNWDHGVLVDERDLASVEMVPVDGHPEQHSILLHLQPEAADWLARRIKMYSLWDDPDMVAILLDGKPLMSPRLDASKPVSEIRIDGKFSPVAASSLLITLQSLISEPPKTSQIPPPLIPVQPLQNLLKHLQEDAMKLLCVDYGVASGSGDSKNETSFPNILQVNLETGEGYYSGRDHNEYELAVKDDRSVTVLKSSPPQVTISQPRTASVRGQMHGYDSRVLFPLEGTRSLSEALRNLIEMKQSPYGNWLQILFRESENSEHFYEFEMVDLYFDDLMDTTKETIRDGFRLAASQKTHANRYRIRMDKRRNWALTEVVRYLPLTMETTGLEVPCERVLSTTTYSDHVELDGIWLPKTIVVSYEKGHTKYSVENIRINDPSKMKYDAMIPSDAVVLQENASAGRPDQPVMDTIASNHNERSGSQNSNSRKLSFKLMDGETGNPLQGLRCQAIIAKRGASPSYQACITDEYGVVEVAVARDVSAAIIEIPSGWFTNDIVPWHMVATPESEQQTQPNENKNNEEPKLLKLWRGTEVDGRLLWPDQTPAAGVKLTAGVYIHDQSWKKKLGMDLTWYSFDHGDWPNWSRTIVTDDDGKFRVTVPPKDARNWFRIGTTFLGFSPQTSAGKNDAVSGRLAKCVPLEIQYGGISGSGELIIRDIPGPDDMVLHAGDLQLETGVMVRGRVVDSQGNGLANVSLTTTGLHGPHSGRSATSGEDGKFEFPAMAAGNLTVHPDARLREDKANAIGEVVSRDVQAVFVDQSFAIPAAMVPHQITIRAVAHTEVSFEWVDRRKDTTQPIAYYGAFLIRGYMPDESGNPETYWTSETEQVERDGKRWLTVKIPTRLLKPELMLVADSKVTASYSDSSGVTSGPGIVPLGDITSNTTRTIFGDEPRESEDSEKSEERAKNDQSSWIPVRPLKVAVLGGGSAKTFDDHSVGLEGDVRWQEASLQFGFDEDRNVEELRLEILPVDSPTGPQFGRGGEDVMFDVKPGIEDQTGKFTSLDFASCTYLQNPADETTVNCIDYLTDTGWKVPKLPSGATAHELVFRFEKPIALRPGQRLTLTIDSGGAEDLAVLNRIRFAFRQGADAELRSVDSNASGGDEGLSTTTSAANERVEPWEISKLYEADFLRNYLQDHEVLPKPIVVPAVRGTVFDPNGNPTSGVSIVSHTPRHWVDLEATLKLEPHNTGGVKKSMQNGTFGLPERTEPYRVLFVHESGVANVSHEELLRANGIVRLQKWASVTGTLKRDGKPQAGETIILNFDTLPWSYSRGGPRLTTTHRTTTNQEGGFSFDRAPPLGGVAMSLRGQNAVYECKSGKNTHIELGEGTEDTHTQSDNHDHLHDAVNQEGQPDGKPPLPRLIVKTVDSHGKPVPDTGVLFYDRNSQRAGQKQKFEMVSKQTDASGVADFGVMPNSFGCLQLSSNKELAECYTLISASMTKCTQGKPERANVRTEIKDGILTVTFTMTPHVDLEFNIVDDVTNEIVFWSEIFYQDPTSKRWWQFGLVDGSQRQHHFIPISPQITRETIRISALGYETKVFRLPVDLDRNQPIRRDIRLKPMPDVKLNVVLPDGTPAEKAKLTFHYPNELDCLQDHELRSDIQGIVTTQFPPNADIGIFRLKHTGGTAELSMRELLDDVKQKPGGVVQRRIKLERSKNQNDEVSER